MKEEGGGRACVLVIFGATGNLAERKLYPALWALHREGMLPYGLAVVGVARREMTSGEFRREFRRALGEHSRFPSQAAWPAFSRRLHYLPFDIYDAAGFRRLGEFMGLLDEGRSGNRLFYLAVAPDHFAAVIDNLAAAGLAPNAPPAWQRLMVEKPLGRDLGSAEALNRQIRKLFPEERIYRVDHYLGKEMIQNITVLRLANTFFEPVWNRHYIDNIQISAMETVGVERRGAYYERAGALRDMVQNHLLQLLSLMAMEPPAEAGAVRAEKVKVLRALRAPEGDVVRGQYGPGWIDGERAAGYREEPGVDPASPTETFVAMKVFVDNQRWAGVPFYLRTGKRLAVQGTEIFLQFRSLPGSCFFGEAPPPDLLVIRVNPWEGVHLQFNVKRPGIGNVIMPITMDFCQNCDLAINSPESYESLLSAALRGDRSLFTGWEEVALAWQAVDPMAAAWARMEAPFPNYAAGSLGPAAAVDLIQSDGWRWWPVCGGPDRSSCRAGPYDPPGRDAPAWH